MKTILFLVVSITMSFADSFCQPAEIIVDNGKLKLKLDLTRGGAICYISISGSDENLVNVYDEGRYIQQSYYAGNRLDRRSEGQSPYWSPWSWNPIQVGDYYRNRAAILDYKQNEDTLYVKCIPMLWDMNNAPAEAVIEQWTILDGSSIKVHNKLTCNRTDTIYGESIPNDQELPAVYPISKLKNLFTYSGENPFSNGPVEKLAVVNLSSGFWGRYNSITEHWMAFTEDNKWGIGIYNPNCTNFLAGMSGTSGGDALAKSTSYIAPVKVEALSKNSVYEYEYYIIIGSIDEIRTKVYQLYHAQSIINE
ncbi:MAG: hypothetical protein AB1521_01410 [Bacteroidota bacterium]